ncbi:chemotaxis protein CheD [Fluviispira multicolorata]|uniref:Probable chemoreceptor glutamine deamidase CheD n=1 Tax=Fluviispira multicolorata TaxID=2654512 RepID=A0A833JG98_9BACT|nr:chemotaxis protein CheD [Fluviispira multicolorata]KAB8033740.1 chemotaxis protein CheD [Fluviispira multicolorata]
MNSVFLYPGHALVTKEPTQISTVLGSCIAVALYCPERKMGGLNHFLLPYPIEENNLSLKYGTNAIAFLYSELHDLLNGKFEHIQAKLYGGGNILGTTIFPDCVGKQNIDLAFLELEKLKIPVVEYNVGGSLSRRIKFTTHTFEVFHEFVG